MAKIDNNLEYIREMALDDADGLIEKSETRYANIISNICKAVNGDSLKEIVMLAGPSASGKTTTAGKIREGLENLGHKAYTVSLDDFYKNIGEGPKNEDGTYDFESVDSLDVEKIRNCFNELIDGGESELPLFDFMTGRRKKETNYIRLEKDDVIIVEGLHALNPVITDSLPIENLLKVYVSLSSRIYNDKDDIILNKRNMRFVRRLVRDYRFRNSTVEHTYSLWPKVLDGEEKYLFPYKNNADILVNSIHIYEPCVLKKDALEMLGTIKRESPDYLSAVKLIRALEKFPEISREKVPEHSLLREFLGN